MKLTYKQRLFFITLSIIFHSIYCRNLCFRAVEGAEVEN
jgi:hypothetical protein